MKKKRSKRINRLLLRSYTKLLRCTFEVGQDSEFAEDVDAVMTVERSLRRRVVRLRGCLGLSGERSMGGRELTKSVAVRRQLRELKASLPSEKMNGLHPSDNPANNQSARGAENGK